MSTSAHSVTSAAAGRTGEQRRGPGLRAALRGLAGRPTFWAGALLLVLPFVLFWPVWWPAEAARRSFAFGDFVEQYYPMRAFVAAEWRAGRLPLWDPYTYSGGPAAAASLFAAFYPPGLWLALFPAPFPFVALEIEAIFHLGLGGLFTLLFVRRLTGSTAAGLLAGLAFGLGGFLTSYPVLQLGILETAIWLPLGLWLVEGCLAERSLRRAALAGIVFAVALLAGHPQTFLYIACVTAAYFVVRAVQLRVPWQQAAVSAVALGAVTALAGAIQWLPSLELAPLSPRAALSYEAVSNGFRPEELWGIVRANRGEWSPLYAGLIPLALAVLGAATQWRRAWFWLLVAVVAGLLALGRNGFLYPLAHEFVPGMASFRNQERAAFLVSFALAVLAGYGYSALTAAARWPRRRWAVLAAPALLAGLTFADLYGTNFGLTLSPSSQDYFPKTGITEHLRVTGSADWRTSSEGLLPGDGNAGQVYRLRDVTGNSPLHLAAYDRFLEEIPEARFWQLLNVQHLVTRRDVEHGAALKVLEEDGVRLYQIFGAQPAWITHDYRVSDGLDEALTLTSAPDLDPAATAVLDRRPGAEPAPPTGDETVRLAQFGPQRVVIEANLTAPGILVSSEISYPGWVAYLDGARVETLRAYGLLRAVALPAGASRIEWRYESPAVRAGLALSLAGVGLAAALAATERCRSRHRQDGHAET